MNQVKPFLSLLFAFLFGFSGVALAQHDNHGEKPKLDIAGTIFGHVADAHSIHIVGDVAIPLPVIAYKAGEGISVFSASHFGHHFHDAVGEDGKPFKISETYNGFYLEQGIKEKLKAVDGSKVIDFSITKNVVCMLLSIIIILGLFISMGNKYKRNGAMKAPSGMQNALEPVITFIRDEVAKPSIGKHYARFMPLLLSVFFFIWINNMLGLLPFGFNFTGNIAVTLSLAFVSFVVMIASGNKHFWSHLLNPPGVPFGVKIILVIIEIISLFIKPIALTIRLFANMLAGHIIILMVIMLIFIFSMAMSTGVGIGFTPISLVFAIFMFTLELLVAAIQAFIFANLTAVFIGQSVEEGHDHDAAHEVYHPVNPETGQAYEVSTKEIIA